MLNQAQNNKNANEGYDTTLRNAFATFPDNYEELRKQQLAYFHYFATKQPCTLEKQKRSLEMLIEKR